ncbi:unnamed protein product [Rotaria sp. Silwood1]|nr:unnamed protein product [Rotaria sp. Silwood1]
MSEKQPLLKTLNNMSTGDNHDENRKKKQLWTRSFSDWCRCFNGKEDDNKYAKPDNDIKPGDRDEAVGVFHLVSVFRRNRN